MFYRRNYYKPHRVDDIINELKEGKRVVYCCTEQKQFDLAKKRIIDTLKYLGEDESIIENLVCQLPGNSPGLSAKLYIDES